MAREWVVALQEDTLPVGKSAVAKIGDRQILIFNTAEHGYFACNNRCPHEGFPLKEGQLANGCILTCNWHNWKFDLASGETLIGGDKLRQYPVRANDGRIEVDIAPLPAERVIADALDNLKDSFRRHEYDRMARALGRMQRAGANPMDAIGHALVWTHDRLEYGMTHAHAAAPDWLALRSILPADDPRALVPLLEIVGHMAWDSLREQHYPFTADTAPAYDAAQLLAAIEAEDEATAVPLVRAALTQPDGFKDLLVPLAKAALAHYADFGHSAIYVYKSSQFAPQLPAPAQHALALVLVRSLIYATREDLIPEFRSYADFLKDWSPANKATPDWQDFLGKNPRAAMQLALQSSGRPEDLYHALFHAAAWNLLHFDLSWNMSSDNNIQDNVSWLDCTHALTFANAGRQLALKDASLWPAVLLQLACFVGRNARYVDADMDTASYQVCDAGQFYSENLDDIIDHGTFEYIVSCHLIKVLTAAREETLDTPGAPWMSILAAAVNRFLNSGLKRKHTLRTAKQALNFVARE